MKFSLVTRAILLNVKAELKAVKDEIDYQTVDKADFALRVGKVIAFFAVWMYAWNWLIIPKITKMIVDSSYMMGRQEFLDVVVGVLMIAVSFWFARRRWD